MSTINKPIKTSSRPVRTLSILALGLVAMTGLVFVQDATSVKSDNLTFIILPGSINVPKYANPFTVSITALGRLFSPAANVILPIL